MIAFALASLTCAAPRVAMLTTGPSDPAAAASQEIRKTVAEAELDVVELDCRTRRACLEAAQNRCEYLVATNLRAHGGELEARVELIDVRTGAVLGTTANSSPMVWGVAMLDLHLLAVEVLAQLTAPEQLPPGGSALAESESEPEPEPEPELEPEVAEPVQPPVVPRVRPRGLYSPSAEPIPSEGARVGHCVSVTHHGTPILLDPDDWDRYRRHRRNARNPMPLGEWIDEQNTESIAMNVAWITPPVLLALGLLADSEELTVLGGGTLPLAVIAALFDVADVGSVDPCRP